MGFLLPKYIAQCYKCLHVPRPPPQPPVPRTAIHRAGGQGSGDRGSAFCDFPLVSALCLLFLSSLK